MRRSRLNQISGLPVPRGAAARTAVTQHTGQHSRHSAGQRRKKKHKSNWLRVLSSAGSGHHHDAVPGEVDEIHRAVCAYG